MPVTVHTCTTPKEGWSLCSQFLGDLLLIIEMQGSRYKVEKDEAGKNKRKRVIDDMQAQLVGSLYMIRRRMKLYAYNDEATKMQQIIDMVIEQDLTDPEVCKAIHAKHTELNTSYRELLVGLVKHPAKDK
jgi:hypothetical protein